MHTTFRSRVFAFLLCAAVGICSFAATGKSGPVGRAGGQGLASLKEVPARLQPDNRYEADILVIVAHPDDESLVTAYLARAIDEPRRVDGLWFTSGKTGSGKVGYVAGDALGAERKIEMHRAVAFLGITNVWDFGAADVPSQNVLWSLEGWNHGHGCEQRSSNVQMRVHDAILCSSADSV